MPLAPADIPVLSRETQLLCKQILETLGGARRVQIIGHQRPDGDCIGSLLALHHLLTAMGVPSAMASSDRVYEGYKLVPGYDEIELAPREGFQPDWALFADCADRKRAFPHWESGDQVIVIDHHASNAGFGAINWIEPACAATAEMVYYLWLMAGLPIPVEAANAMLLGIMTDTGSLRFSNVRPVHFEICAELLRAGGDVTLVSRAAWETRPAQSVILGATVLAGVRFSCGGQVAWGEVRQESLTKLGGMEKLPENLVNEIRSIEGVRVGILFTETTTGGARVSLRGDGSVNVSEIALEFGGGGHPNAAGITMEAAPYETSRDRVIARVSERIEATAR